VHDPITIQELLWFIINPRGRAEAQAGCHDDTTIALALMVVVMARMPRPIVPSAIAAPKVALYGKPARGADRRGTLVKRRGGKWVTLR
jgi:hypothetical protein